jgi:NAD-dependent dihydropyrimidine dehydrogenase PreA subunit
VLFFLTYPISNLNFNSIPIPYTYTYTRTRTYTYTYTYTHNTDFSLEEKQTLVDCCPTNVFEIEGNNNNDGINTITGMDITDSNRIVIKDPNLCIFCRECIHVSEEMRKIPEDDLAINIKHNPTKFYFTVESTGALDAKTIVSDALHVLEEKLNKLQMATANCKHI